MLHKKIIFCETIQQTTRSARPRLAFKNRCVSTEHGLRGPVQGETLREHHAVWLAFEAFDDPGSDIRSAGAPVTK